MNALKTYFIFLLICNPVFSQDSIFKADGSKSAIDGASVKIDSRSKKLSYKLTGSDATNTASFKDFNKVTLKGQIFRTFKTKKKVEGYYVLTDFNGLTLATSSKTGTTNTGGFTVKYVKHDVVIFRGDAMLEAMSFYESNDRKNVRKRIKARETILSYFKDCREIVDKLELFRDTDSPLQEAGIVGFLSPPFFSSCK